jgi:hypothetical protein
MIHEDVTSIVIKNKTAHLSIYVIFHKKTCYCVNHNNKAFTPLLKPFVYYKQMAKLVEMLCE